MSGNLVFRVLLFAHQSLINVFFLYQSVSGEQSSSPLLASIKFMYILLNIYHIFFLFGALEKKKLSILCVAKQIWFSLFYFTNYFKNNNSQSKEVFEKNGPPPAYGLASYKQVPRYQTRQIRSHCNSPLPTKSTQSKILI